MEYVRRVELCLPALLGSLLVLGQSGCSASTTANVDAVVRSDSSGVVIVRNDLTRLDRVCAVSDTPRVVIGNHANDPNHELYRVFGATVLTDGRIVVVNQGSAELRFFSPTGDFLAAAGGEGEGPGEFQDAFLLWKQPGDTLWVGDYRPWEFEIFSPDGEWVRGLRPEPWYSNPPDAVGILSDGRVVFGGENFSERDPDFGLQLVYLILHRADGTMVDTIAVLPNGRRGKVGDDPRSPWLFPWFESFLQVAARGNQLVIAHGSKAEVRFYDVADGLELDHVIRWSTNDRAVTGADIDAARQALVRRYENLDPAMRQILVDPMVSPDRPAADSFPALTGLSVGSDGSIWIKEFSRTDRSGPASWIRFNDRGEFECRLELDGEKQVFEFGTDYVLVKEEGDEDVEVVALYDWF